MTKTVCLVGLLCGWRIYFNRHLQILRCRRSFLCDSRELPFVIVYKYPEWESGPCATRNIGTWCSCVCVYVCVYVRMWVVSVALGPRDDDGVLQKSFLRSFSPT